jgi:uncharacterized membrane protein
MVLNLHFFYPCSTEKEFSMKSKIRIFGHPVHPMLVSFPIAFYVGAFTSYFAYLMNADPLWFRIGLVANIAGVAMALVAAIPGFIDLFFAIPKRSMARQTGLLHMSFNLLSLALFATAAFINYVKWFDASPLLGPTLLLTGIGVISTATAGFFGWTMVQRHHMGVDLTPEHMSLEAETQQKIYPKTTTTGSNA